MNTSAPRIDSPNRQWSSPFANSAMLHRARGRRRALPATSSASSRLTRPATMVQPLLGDQLHASLQIVRQPSAAESVERRRCAKSDGTSAPRPSTAYGPTCGTGRRSWRVRAVVCLDRAVRADARSRPAGCSARSRCRRRSTVVALEDHAGEQRDVATDGDGRVDVDVFDGSSIVTPERSSRSLVRRRSSASADRELEPVVDALASRRRRRPSTASTAVARAGRAPRRRRSGSTRPGELSGCDPPQRGREQAPAEAVDRGVDLVDLELLGGGVALLDDADAPVRPCRGRPARTRWGRPSGPSAAVAAASGRPVVRRPARPTVSARSSGASPSSTITSASSSSSPGGRPGRPARRRRCRAGPAARRTRSRGRRPPPRDLLGDPVALVADDDHGALSVSTSLSDVEHVHEHRPTAEPVERLGPLGSHATALAGREDHDGGQGLRGRLVSVIDHRCSRGRDRTCNLLIQSPAFCQLNYPRSGMRPP